MNLTGYSDRWSVRPGETISFHVHCMESRYEAQVVRLGHGDPSQRGPGFKEVPIDAPINGLCPGEPRTIQRGSYGLIETPGIALDAFTVTVWLWPTLPGRGRQTLINASDAAAKFVFELAIDENGRLKFQFADAPSIVTERKLDVREWYFVAASYEATARSVNLFVRRQRLTPLDPAPFEGRQTLGVAGPTPRADQLVIAAALMKGGDCTMVARDFFNGKLAAPLLFSRALKRAELLRVAQGEALGDTLAVWDFAQQTHSTRIVDAGPNGLHGRTINRPARLMTGPLWDGDIKSLHAYNAIHFHEDDVTDVEWPASFHLTVPADWRSGVYAVRLRSGADEDHLPFIVCPPRYKMMAPIALLLPTLSYLAYSNESLDPGPSVSINPLYNMDIAPEVFQYIDKNGLKSTYDKHIDGSGICYASMRRPVLDFRPRARARALDAPHQFAADLCIVDWLEEKGFGFDVITDHELHAEGADLLRGYVVVLTGSHPEYWTHCMIEARDAYLSEGGRLMYLGGNGFYWVTSISDEDPYVMEIRRFVGTRSWQAEPGEFWHSLSGEFGGIWRDRGKAPQKAVGVGFSGQGFDRGAPYRRTRESYDPAFDFIFEDVPNEIIGAGPSLVLNHGAAGFEVDKADYNLGTPFHAALLASSEGLTNAYQLAVEQSVITAPWNGARDNPRVGADIVFFSCPNNGAVFSVGSIIWTATLSSSGYDSDTSRVTANVLRAFMRPDWRPPLSSGQSSYTPNSKI